MFSTIQRPLVTFHQKSNGSMVVMLCAIQISVSGAMFQRWRRRKTNPRRATGAATKGAEAISGGEVFTDQVRNSPATEISLSRSSQHDPRLETPVFVVGALAHSSPH